MAVSIEEVMIAIHENALDEMYKRQNRIGIQIFNLQEELKVLVEETSRKRDQIQRARDQWLARCV